MAHSTGSFSTLRLALLVALLALVVPETARARVDSPEKEEPKTGMMKQAKPGLTKKGTQLKPASPSKPTLKRNRLQKQSGPALLPKDDSKLVPARKAVRPQLRMQGDGRPGTTPRTGEGSQPNLPEVHLPPKITATSFHADPAIGHIGGAIFAPGGTVILEGMRFGDSPGAVELRVNGSKFPEHGDRIPLAIQTWTDTRIEAVVPKPMTGPLFRAGAPVAVRTARGQEVVGPGHFEVPVETRALKFTDDAVRLVTCGDSGSDNGCHNSQFYGPSTINGFHTEGRVSHGSDGSDVWVIQLGDGWVFSELERVVWEVTGADGDFMNLIPDFPKGETRWEPEIRWRISADDSVNYHLRIHVKRAKGAY